jgi:putative FmdB family regulatory protein
MPTYEYLCRSCGVRLEVVQSFSDLSLTTCDACGGELRKVFSAAGLIFKGSGWHVKDYATTSPGSSTSAASPTSGPADAPSTAAAKPESSSAPAPAAPTSSTTAASSSTSSTSSTAD